jgi:hypothetical protein
MSDTHKEKMIEDREEMKDITNTGFIGKPISTRTFAKEISQFLRNSIIQYSLAYPVTPAVRLREMRSLPNSKEIEDERQTGNFSC